MTRQELLEHLLDESGHNAMGYAAVHPEVLSSLTLYDWHNADHGTEEGVGPKDGHTHDVMPWIS